MSRRKLVPTEPKTDVELGVECIEALCDLSVAAARLARMAYDGAQMMAERMFIPEEEK